MVRRSLWQVAAICALGVNCFAQPVLEHPAPGQVAFRPADLDAHADRTFQERIANDRQKGWTGCKRHCARLSRLVARLAEAARLLADAPPVSWQLAVSTNPSETAWSLAGGRMYISEAFIDDFRMTDTELAFVLGHEMSHSLLQHENESLTVAAEFAPRGESRTVDSMYEALGVDIGLVFDLQPEIRAEEFEADRAAMLLAGAAGFDPEMALGFLRKLAGRSSERNTLLDTHPEASERLRRAQAVRYSAEVLRARAAKFPAP